MAILRSTARTLGRLAEHAGRSRARRELLMRSDRTLADAGLSRALLESGNAAWPWRIEPDGSTAAFPPPPAPPLPLSRIVTGSPVPVSIVTAARGERDASPERWRQVA